MRVPTTPNMDKLLAFREDFEVSELIKVLTWMREVGYLNCPLTDTGLVAEYLGVDLQEAQAEQSRLEEYILSEAEDG